MPIVCLQIGDYKETQQASTDRQPIESRHHIYPPKTFHRSGPGILNSFSGSPFCVASSVIVLTDDMQEQLKNRLRELKAEFEAGQSKLAEVEGQANNLRTTMLRISGAIQVLEEELAKASGAAPGAEAGQSAESKPAPGIPQPAPKVHRYNSLGCEAAARPRIVLKKGKR